MNTLLKAAALSLICVSGLTLAAEDPRGEFVKLDRNAPMEDLLVTPLACKYFTALAIELTNKYLEGENESQRLRYLADEVVANVYNDDAYAGNALAVRFNSNIVKVLGDPTIKKDIGYGYTYPESVKRQMPKLCANMVGTKTDHLKRIFQHKS